jgi:hypothetical protein
MGFFEENPLVFVAAVVVIVEVWLRLRVKLFATLRPRRSVPREGESSTPPS